MELTLAEGYFHDLVIENHKLTFPNTSVYWSPSLGMFAVYEGSRGLVIKLLEEGSVSSSSLNLEEIVVQIADSCFCIRPTRIYVHNYAFRVVELATILFILVFIVSLVTGILVNYNLLDIRGDYFWGS